MRKPAYSTLVKELTTLLALTEDLGHNGVEPSWAKPCPKCAIVRHAQKIRDAAQGKK